jgi:hypothetical protein
MTATVSHDRPIVSGLNLLLAVAALVLATIALVQGGDDGPEATRVGPATPAAAAPASPPRADAGAPASEDAADRAPMVFYGCDGTIGANRC